MTVKELTENLNDKTLNRVITDGNDPTKEEVNSEEKVPAAP